MQVQKSQVGLYGLGVMGRNLALNIEEKGFRLSVFNRMVAGEKHLLTNFMEDEVKTTRIHGKKTLGDFVESLERPRIIILMIAAGDPVDEVIDQLLPMLEQQDIIIDGGNSHFKNTERRVTALKNEEIYFVGMGVSGGEMGVRNGPSLMPGGNPAAWKPIKPVLEAIAARNPDDNACCTWIGENGAGHFVKMVHDGIEYADMQLIAECYHFMKELLELSYEEIASVFETWNSGFLESYLIEITIDILRNKDSDGDPLLPKILDVAGQKGMGKWTAGSALDLGVAAPVISHAVASRFLSTFVELRKSMADDFSAPDDTPEKDKSIVIDDLELAFSAGRIMAHHEGFLLIQSATKEYGWNVDLASVAQIWQGGCIIRSSMLAIIEAAFHKGNQRVLESPYFRGKIAQCLPGWRQTVSRGVLNGIPLPGLSSALSQFDAYRSGRLPVNLIQAQRDYVGAHTYERIDKPRGEYFHTDWKANLKHE